MSQTKEQIEGYLKQMGLAAALAPVPNATAPSWAGPVNYNGVQLTVMIDGVTTSVAGLLGFGFLPKTNVAPLFRKMLALNNSLIHTAFGIQEANNMLVIRFCRSISGMDFDEFKAMLDSLTATFHQHAAMLVSEFEISTSPE